MFCHFQVVPAAASEKGTENSAGGAGAAAPTPPSSLIQTEQKSGKTILSEDESLNHPLKHEKGA